MGTPPEPDKDDASEGVSLDKGDPTSEAPFDPYRFGAPDHPIPAEYAPPGYTGPVIPTQAPYPPASNPWAPPGPVPPPYGQPPPGYPPGYGAPYGQPPPQSPYGPAPSGPYPPYPNPYGGPPAPYGYPQPKPGTNGLAIASLVLAFLCSVAGLVCGIVALNQINQRPQPGKGLAIAGIVVSVLSIIAAAIYYGAFRK